MFENHKKGGGVVISYRFSKSKKCPAVEEESIRTLTGMNPRLFYFYGGGICLIDP